MGTSLRGKNSLPLCSKREQILSFKSCSLWYHARIQEFLSGGWGGGGGGGGGGSRSIWQKKIWRFFFCFFLVLSLFYRSQMVNFKDNYHLSRFQRGSNIFQGGPTFSRGGGVQLLIAYRNPYNLWFSRGGGGGGGFGPPVPPSGSALGYGKSLLPH